MTISELNNILTTLAKSNYLVNEAFTGDVYNIDFKENKFGCFVATPMTGTKNDGTITYNYTLYYVDRLTKSEDNIDFVQSDAVRVLKGIINFLEEHSIEVDDEYQITLFRHQFDDWCAGAYVEVNLTIPDGDCDDDFNLSGDLRSLVVDKNGNYIPKGFDGYNRVTVNVPQTGATEEWVDEEIDLKLQNYTENYVDVIDNRLNERIDVVESSLSGYATVSYVDSEIARVEGEIPSLDGYATESWVEAKGYLTEHQSLEGYATESWVEEQGYLTEHQSLTGYATEEWVEGQGYLTEHQSLEGYATESWVEGQGYLTEHQSLTGYATEEWVEGQGYLTEHQSLTGYATESWVEAKGYLTEHQDITGKADISYVDSGLSGKQDTLIAGTNITIEDNVISATGGSGDVPEYVTEEGIKFGEIDAYGDWSWHIEDGISLGHWGEDDPDDYSVVDINNSGIMMSNILDSTNIEIGRIGIAGGYDDEEEGHIYYSNDIDGQTLSMIYEDNNERYSIELGYQNNIDESGSYFIGYGLNITKDGVGVRIMPDSIDYVDYTTTPTTVTTITKEELLRVKDIDSMVKDVTLDGTSVLDDGVAVLNTSVITAGLATVSYVDTSISSKQDTISDLSTIRSGAALGATALQEHQDISGKANITYVDQEIARVENEIPSLSGYATESWVLSQGYLTTESDPVFVASPAYTITSSDITSWNGKQNTISDLSTIRSGAALGATSLQSSKVWSGTQAQWDALTSAEKASYTIALITA